jgi:hypothetical protein
MVMKIISGGQTGVDRAALDVARAKNLPSGGWCPKGRRAEDGSIPADYPLEETEVSSYEARTELNVRDSDATLIILRGPPSGGTAYTIAMAEKWNRPCRIVDLRDENTIPGTRDWLASHRIATLNVAGPRESTSPGIYADAVALLTQLLPRTGAETPVRG